MNIALKDPSHGPVYAQVRQQVEALIAAGALASGESIPSPAALGQTLGVDKGEIQRAYFELEQLRLIERKTSKDFLGQAKTTYRVV